MRTPMSYHKFRSLLNSDKYVFVYNTDGDWDRYYRFVCPLDIKAWVYETLGDGMTAHTPDMPVGVDLFVDYCVSLAQYILTSEPDAVANIGRFGIVHLNRDAMAFAFNVKRTEKEKESFIKKFFCVSERKMSANDAKRHDKRWHEVRDCHDGTVSGAFNVLWDGQENHRMDLLERYTWYRDLLEFGSALKQFTDPYGAEKLLPSPMHENKNIAAQAQAQDFRPIRTPMWAQDYHLHAWRALDAAFAALEHRVHAMRLVECLQTNLARKASAA